MSRLEDENHTLFTTKMAKISLNRSNLFMTKTAGKTIAFGAAYTFITHLTVGSPHGPLRAETNFVEIFGRAKQIFFSQVRPNPELCLGPC